MPITKRIIAVKRPGHLHVKKGDTVLILAGKDAGRQGVILQSLPSRGRVVVENVNMATRHQRPQQGGGFAQQQSGRIQRAAPMDASNVMLVCPSCNKPARTTRVIGEGGRRVRTCKRCGEYVDKV